MNILKCFVSFVLLLLYVQFNSAVDWNVLQAKIREPETTITTLEAKLAKDKSDPTEATSCLAFGNSSDIQTIRVPGAEAFQVLCNSRFAGEGWTVIQRRMDGSVSFNQNWDEYKNGFGDLRGEFWLGLERLHLMTKFRPHELYIQLENFKNETRYVRYSNFSVGNEAQSYELLSLGNFTGNAGNLLDAEDVSSAKNMKFSTPERDNDKAVIYNCAAEYASAENNDQYEKLQQRETTIKSLESKANANKEALSNCSEDKLKAEKETLKLQLIIKELEYKELLTNHTKQREQTNLEAQQEALRKSNELISEKDKRIVDLDKELEARVGAQKETLKETQQLQAKVKELQTKIKESDKLKDSLISEKDKRIAEIKEQLSSMEHENKLLKDELTKQKDRAEATSCLPSGNSSDTQTLRLPGVNAFRDYKTQSEKMFKDLVEYETKIEQLESTIKNLTANAGASEKCAEPSDITKEKLKKLQDKIRQQETEIRALKPKNNEQQQLTKSSSRKCDELAGTTTDKFDKLINKFTDELKREFKEQLASEISKLQEQQHSHQQANIIEQNSTINKLKAAPNEQELAKDKQKGRTDLKVQNGINPAEATSCLAFGNSNDIQTIRVPGVEAFQVPCDSKIPGNGWTVIQRRMDGSVNFNRTWDEYKNGFGDL
ncbi:maker531 [Drosophila busckii]|uniref:Maker531 n=1 Tax=Drosophila busckii TaxID=30019 RepID=A0A0M4EGJ2_DROBS|nr:maker531 [Drosophila busckii]